MANNVSPRYGFRSYVVHVVITPVRDEEEYLPRTVESMIKQTMLPVQWVLVNDGSKDRTGILIDAAAKQHGWITAVHRPDRGYRKWGAGIIEAFYAGHDALHCHDWQFMTKLDGDLSFEPTYFERLFACFDSEAKLGIGGGVLYHEESGRWLEESHPKFHVRGGVKTFRRACWEDIGGLWVGPGSDTADEVKANMLGWCTRSFADIRLVHHRFTGATWGRWGGLVKDGKIDYVLGYHPLFVAAKTLRRLAKKPYVAGALVQLYGFVAAWREGMPQVDDARMIRYLRRQQMLRLLGRESIWK